MFSLGFFAVLAAAPFAVALFSFSSSSRSLSPSGRHSKSTTPSILMLFLPCRPIPGSSYTLICWPGVTRATNLSSGLHLSAGHCICFFASSPSGYTLGNVRRRLPVLMSQTATLLPSSSGEKYCGPCSAPSRTTMGSYDQVTMYCSFGEKSMSLTSGCANRCRGSQDGPPHRRTPCRWRVAKNVPMGDHETYRSVQFYRTLGWG